MAFIQKYIDSTQDERIIQSGYKLRTVTTKNNNKFSLYMKDTREAEKAHVAQSGWQDILIKQCESALMTHPIHSKIGREACCAVESAVKANLSPKVLLMFEEEEQVHFAVGCYHSKKTNCVRFHNCCVLAGCLKSLGSKPYQQ